MRAARATALAERLQEGLEELGVYRREAAALAAARDRAPLPRAAAACGRRLPELGEVVPSDAAVFISRLRPGGAEYEVLETVALGG